MSTEMVLTERPCVALTVETVAELSRLADLEPRWRELELAHVAPSLFQSFAWSQFVWRTLHAVGSREALTCRVVVVSEAGRPVLLLPLRITSAFGGRIAEGLSEPFGQYTDGLVAAGSDANALMDVAWREIKSWGVDALVLRKVRADAALSAWLALRGRAVGDTQRAPSVALHRFETFEAYRATLNSKTRKNLRNYRNRLNRLGVLTHETVDDPETRAQLTRMCLAWRSRWLADSGLSSTAFRHPAFERLVEGLADGRDGAPALKVMRLQLARDGAAPVDVAVQWGFEHRNRYYAFMSAKDPDFDEYSPGRLHLEDIVTACSASGCEVVDFLMPDMPYKSTWATDHEAVDTYGVSATLKGRAFVDGWHGNARPALKAAFLKLPVGWRKAAADFVRSDRDKSTPGG